MIHVEVTNIQDDEPRTNDKTSDKNKKGAINFYTAFCLFIGLFGSSFQFGWYVSIFNNPFQAIKAFYGEVYVSRYNQTMTDDAFTTLWSITNAMNPLGAIFGALVSGIIADKLGRKRGLLVSNIFVVLTAIFIIISKFIKSYETVMVGRFCSGVLTGLYNNLIALYIDEMAPPRLRGAIGILAPLFLSAGKIIVSTLGLPFILGNADLWFLLGAIPLAPALFQIGLLFAVETPKYTFINKNDEKKAYEILKKLRGDHSLEDIDKEMNALQIEKERLAKRTKVKLHNFVSKRILIRPLIITCAMQVANQLSGINALNFYSTSIFIDVGLSGYWPMYFSIFLNVIQIITTIFCVLLVEKFGRRKFFLTGLIGMCISATMISVTRVLAEDESRKWMGYITVVFAFLYQTFYTIGPYAVTSVIIMELFDTDARGRASALTVTVTWSFNLIVTITFPFIEKAIKSYSFLIFAGCLAFFSIFVFIFLPETKGKSIHEIHDHFDKGWLAIRRTRSNKIADISNTDNPENFKTNNLVSNLHAVVE